MNLALYLQRTATTCADAPAVYAGDSLQLSYGALLQRTSALAGHLRDVLEATRKTLREGWLLAGDTGFLDGEGFLTLRDRSKDLIISGGSNIYPREVEEILLTHPDVSEVAVIGELDPEWGEVPVAFVVARTGSALDPASLDRLCLDNLARFKRPKSYRLVASLPKNSYGKVLKTELRQQLAAA